MNNRCAEWFAKFNELSAEGAYYTALSYLARIFAAVSMLPENDRPRWVGVIKRNRPSAELIARIQNTAQKDIGHLDRILSVGGDYIDEEILAVLSTREDIELIRRLLEEAYKVDFILPLQHIDGMIKKRFARAQMSRASRKLYHKLYLERRAQSRVYS